MNAKGLTMPFCNKFLPVNSDEDSAEYKYLRFNDDKFTIAHSCNLLGPSERFSSLENIPREPCFSADVGEYRSFIPDIL